jgi:hypothetical protein
MGHHQVLLVTHYLLLNYNATFLHSTFTYIGHNPLRCNSITSNVQQEAPVDGPLGSKHVERNKKIVA